MAKKLTPEQISYIKNNANKLPAEEIAKELRRTPNFISKYIKEKLLIAPLGEDVPEKELIQYEVQKDFETSPEWRHLEKELNTEEIEFFKHSYSKYVAQFKGDVLATETTQIFLLIKFELLQHRNMSTKKKMESDIKKTREALGRFQDIPPDRLSDRDKELMGRFQEHIANTTSAIHASTGEYTKLSEKVSQILKELKASREQRFAKVESLKETFVEVIKSLQENDIREREEKQMELMRIATEKEYNRLSKAHEYMDKQVDLPILNSETIIGND